MVTHLDQSETDPRVETQSERATLADGPSATQEACDQELLLALRRRRIAAAAPARLAPKRESVRGSGTVVLETVTVTEFENRLPLTRAL